MEVCGGAVWKLLVPRDAAAALAHKYICTYVFYMYSQHGKIALYLISFKSFKLSKINI